MEPANKKRKLILSHLQPIPFMLCEICKMPVYNYRECQTWIYCGCDCLSVLLLQYENEEGREGGWDSKSGEERWDSA